MECHACLFPCLHQTRNWRPMHIERRNLKQHTFLHLRLQQRFKSLIRPVAWLIPSVGSSTGQAEICWQNNVEKFAVCYLKIGHSGVDVVRNVQNIIQKQKRKSWFTFFFLVDFGEDENTDQFSKILRVLSTPFKTKFYPQDYSPFYD